MIGRLKDLTIDHEGYYVVSFKTKTDFRESFDNLANRDVSIEIKRYYKKRSLDANAFAWVLINKIAAELQLREPRSGWTPIEVYRAAIRDIAGVCTEHCMPNDQVDRFVNDWLSLGDGFQVELYPSKIEGCTNGHFWKGSHIYDSQQMSVLIHNLICTAEELGIATLTEEQAQKIAGSWKRNEKHHSA